MRSSPARNSATSEFLLRLDRGRKRSQANETTSNPAIPAQQPGGFPSDVPARRGRGDGAAVAGVRARMGRTSGQGRGPIGPSAQAFRGAVHGMRRQSGSLVGQRRGRGDGTGQEPGTDVKAPVEDELHHGPDRKSTRLNSSH